MKNRKQKRGKFKIFSPDNRVVIILNKVNKEEVKERKKEEERKRGTKLFFKEIFILKNEY